MEIFFVIFGLLIFGIVEIFHEGIEQNRRIKENMRRYPSMFKDLNGKTSGAVAAEHKYMYR